MSVTMETPANLTEQTVEPALTEAFLRDWVDKSFNVDADSNLQWFQMKDCIQQIVAVHVPDSMLMACGLFQQKINGGMTYVVNDARQRLNWS